MTRLQRKPLQAGMRITHTITNRSRKLLLSNPIIKENLIITLDNQSKSHSLWSVWLPGGPAAIPRPKQTSCRCAPPPLSLSFLSPFSSREALSREALSGASEGEGLPSFWGGTGREAPWGRENLFSQESESLEMGLTRSRERGMTKNNSNPAKRADTCPQTFQLFLYSKLQVICI